MSDEYTPTTDEVRDGYALLGHNPATGKSAYDAGGKAEFDRWLASHDAEVLEDAAQAMRAAKEPYHWNLRDPRDPERSYSPDVWLEARAVRLREGVQ